MTLYTPVFTNKWAVDSFESENVRILGKNHILNPMNNKICHWKKRVGYYGPIYDCNNIFTSEEDAWRWINKDYSVLDNVYTDFKEVGA